jgi:uncharacterized protein HemY
MSETIPCPRCDRKLRVSEEHLGNQVCCPSCRHVFVAEAILPALPVPESEEPGARKRPRRREDDSEADLPVRRPGRKGDRAFLRIGVPVIVVVVLVGVGSLLQAVRSSRSPVPSSSRPPREVAGPDRRIFKPRPKPLTEAEARGEAQQLLDGLGLALRDKDDQRITDHFNVRQMIKEMAPDHPVPDEAVLGPEPLSRRMERVLASTLRELDDHFQWETTQILSAQVASETEIVVVARHRTPKEVGSYKIRWRTIRQSGTLRIADLEWLDLGFRFSDVMAAATIEDEEQGRKTRKALAVLVKALWAGMIHEGPAGAEKLLRELPAGPRPDTVEAARLIVTAVIHFQRKQYQETLDTLAAARRLRPGVPYLDFIEGRALNGLARGKEAFERLSAYNAVLGDDDQLCLAMGVALRHQRRFLEAADAYRKALDCNEGNAFAFQGLILSLGPGDPKADVAERFGKLNDKRDNFDTFVEDTATRDRETLELLADAMCKLDPEYAPPYYHLALLRVQAGQTPEGIARMQTALKHEANLEKRTEYLRGFVEAMLKAGKISQARAVIPEEREAFRFLAPELAKHARTELFALVAAHTRQHADDPLLPLFQGTLLAQNGKYLLAADAFRRGLTRPPPADVLAAIRSSRVQARYHTAGDVAAIYAEIGPRDETFGQLAWLCWIDRNSAGLEALLDARAKDTPDDPQLARFRMRLNIRQNEMPTAIGYFKEIAAKLDDKERASLRMDFLFDAAEAGKLAEGWAIVTDAETAFQDLADTFLEEAKYPELRQLVELFRPNHPDDPWLALYEGELHLKDRVWEKAAAVLGSALQKAQGDLRERLCHQYVHAMQQAGRDREALARAQAAGLGRLAFSSLAGRLADEKKGADLDALIAAYRPQAGGVELLFFEARARLLAGKPAEAIRLFQEAYAKQTVPHQRTPYLHALVIDLAAAGHGLEGYRAAPDRPAAFRILAGWLLEQKKPAELEKLLDEDGARQAGKALHPYYTGQLQLQNGKLDQAARSFASGLAEAAPADRWMLRRALIQARVRAGKATTAYRELGQDQRAFEEVAHLCLAEKNADQLADLVALGRQALPDDPQMLPWEVELKRLRQDHAGVLRLLTDQRDLLCMNPRSGWQYSGWLVRALVKLNRPQDALKEAEALSPSHVQRLLLILAQAATGDVMKTIAALEKSPGDTALLGGCYADEDLGPILRSDAFKAFRDRFPEPDR